MSNELFNPCPDCGFALSAEVIQRPNCTQTEYRCPECGLHDSEYSDIVVKAISQDSRAVKRKQDKLHAIRQHMTRKIASRQEPPRVVSYVRFLDEDED